MKPLLLLLSIGLCVPVWAQNTVSIHVTDMNQKPLPNAQVALSVWSDGQAREESSQTDATGTTTFSLEKPIDPAKPVAVITVHANGFALIGRPIRSKALEFQLRPGASWCGTVVDEAGHPIQGANVGVYTLWQKIGEESAPDDYTDLRRKKGFLELFSTQSGADGTFQLNDLPPGGMVGYSVTEPHFAVAGGSRVPVSEVTRVALSPGASLHGRLLGLDGKPLSDVKVFAMDEENDGYGQARTAPDGTFTIESLKVGHYDVMLDSSAKDFVVVPLNQVAAVGGQTIELPLMRAIEGIVVAGMVRDKASGQPIAGVTVGTRPVSRTEGGGAMMRSEITGADGRFSVRVIEGKNQFYLQQLPANFVRSDTEQIVDVVADKPTPVAFELQKLPILTGTTVDENNRPIKAQLRLWGDQTIDSDAQGHWSWQATALNNVEVGGGENESGYFEVLTNPQWKVPSAAPIVVRLRKHPWQTLQGRVVSRDKTPLAGVEVQASFLFSIGDGGSLSQTVRSATTDAQGRYSFAQIRGGEKPTDMAPNLKVQVERKDLAFVSGGDISREGAIWKASDLVLSALNRHIEGQTEPGARVVAAGKETRADDAGHFAFEGLPEGDTLVCAAANGQFGSVVVADTDKTPLHIELSPIQPQGVDPEVGRAAWLEVSKEGTNAGYYALDWVNGQLAVQSGTTFAALKRTDTGPTTANGDWQLAAQLAQWAPKLPAEGRVAALEEVAGGITRPEIRLDAWLQSAISSDDPAVAKRALREADTALALTPPEFRWRELNLYELAVVTERAQNTEEGKAALSRAMAWTLGHHPEKPFSKQGQIIEPSANQMLSGETAVVAQGSDELFRQLLNSVEPDGGENVSALSEAIPVVERKHGVEAALVLLEELGRLPMPDFKGDNHPSNNEPQWAFNQAARRLIVPLAKKSPARAVELARRITNDKAGLSRALASAAPFQTPDEAAKLWREAIAGADSGDAARFAAQAWERDPKLGSEMFASVRQKIEKAGGQGMRGSAWIAYAFYLARIDPAIARLELEREWAAQMLANGEAGQIIAMAMAAVDGKRALEMARAIPDTTLSLEARRKIGQYLMATTEERRDFPFDRWGAGDTWRPGDPEW